MARWDRLSFNLVVVGVTLLAVALLIAPTVIIFITSFTDSYSLQFPPESYSLRWYRELFNSPQILRAAWNSFEVAAIATTLCVLLGVPAALHLHASRSRWARFLDGLFMSPLVLPALAFGLALVMVVTTAGFALSKTWLIVGHTIISVPFVLRTTIASLARSDPALIESSTSLGASPFMTFRRVTLPLIRPGIIAGAFLAFMWSFDNIPVSLFVSDARTEMLPIRLWQIIQASLDVRAAAASGILVGLTLLCLVLFERAVGLSRHMR
ncbi:ABC transporter permease [Acuticoccus sediminis]|uniref:ABC transporter permease n=1 Tax=Acuticoccus sediminis TaxID=2184697 RepID=A0A8B2NNI3_9HYPH|nr:ABC transporter permease [Acuticoccus sediminis]RAH97242.1 ABC transporter permease [Acuticoccus sediminis]